MQPSPAVLDQWHPIAAREDLTDGQPRSATLLDTALQVQWTAGGAVVSRGDTERPLPVLERYGFLWTSLGSPPPELFSILEHAEPDRFNICAGSIGVNVSAPRAIENFLDMGHFPFVHTDILGAEPHTEVKEYDVEVSVDREEILATRCRFYQPRAALSAAHGQ